MGRLLQKLRRPPAFVTLAFGLVFAGLFVFASLVPLRSDAPRVLDPARFKAALEESLRAGFLDPESARFRDDFVSTLRSTLVVCGEVNHRQGSGGYIGYRRFIAGPTFKALDGPVDPEVMEELWPAMCKREK